MTPDDDLARLSVPVTGRDHAIGAASARVTLVEYGDYGCPHCGRAYPIVKALQRQLGSQLRFVFRNFPLKEMHPHAMSAAEAAEAAGAQGRFWDMHDALFEHQRALTRHDLRQYATALSLDRQRFDDELTGHTHLARVRADFMGGVQSGVNGTPTFFINGLRYDGPSDLESLIEATGLASRT